MIIIPRSFSIHYSSIFSISMTRNMTKHRLFFGLFSPIAAPIESRRVQLVGKGFSDRIPKLTLDDPRTIPGLLEKRINIAQHMSQHCPQIVPTLFKNGKKMSQPCPKLFQHCFQMVPASSRTCFKMSPKMFWKVPKWYPNASKVVANLFNVVPEWSPNHPKVVPICFPKPITTVASWSHHVPKLFRMSPNIFCNNANKGL